MSFDLLVQTWENKTLNNHCEMMGDEFEEELYFNQLSPKSQQYYLKSLVS